MGLSYQIWNHCADSKVAVLAVPAFPLTSSEWEEVARQIPSIPFIAVDHPGIGSLLLNLPTTAESYAEELIHLGQKLGYTRFIVAGNSMGGYVAQAAAIMYPQEVKGLALVGTKANADDSSAREKRFAMARTALHEGDLREVFSGIAKLVAPGFEQSHPEKIQEIRRWASVTSPAGVAWCQEMIATREDRRAQLSELKIPSTVVYGRHDVAATLDDASDMATALGVELVVVPDAGHLLPCEVPKTVADEIMKVYSQVQ